MKRHTQKTGVRRWAGDDLIELQSEPFKVLDAIVSSYAPCVISGCVVTSIGNNYNVSGGIVALTGKDVNNTDVTMVVPFAGATNIALPIYLTLDRTDENRVYADGQLKPIAYNYTAKQSSVVPSVPYLTIATTGTRILKDLVQEAAYELANTKVTKVPGKGLSSYDFTMTHYVKLGNIEPGANKYVHPDNETTRHVTDEERTTWNSKAEVSFVDELRQDCYATIMQFMLDVSDGLDLKEDSIEGKGLSTNDYITSDKNKLANMAKLAGRVVNGTTNGSNGLPALTVTKFAGNPTVVSYNDGAEGTFDIRYRITHNIGHTRYVASFTGESMTFNAFPSYPYIKNITANTIDVLFRMNGNGGEGNYFSNFNFVIDVF